MDYVLEVLLGACYGIDKKVLILLVMDYVLEEKALKTKKLRAKKVLILLVMDYVLEERKKFFRCNTCGGLNPSCNGLCVGGAALGGVTGGLIGGS